MNYSTCLQLLIQACPEKERKSNQNLNWHLADKAKEDLIAFFDTQILETANQKLFDIEYNTDYLLMVGSRYGVMTIKDKITDEFIQSYYLKSGILFGTSTKKKKQFELEVLVLANKNGIFFQDDLSEKKKDAEIGKIKVTLESVLKLFYSS